jgi:P27 family predicted phage terminase small subunit
MMAGRKVIPIEIKKVKGTNRPHREKEVPEPSKEKPLPPSWLNGRAKQIFHHMVRRLDDLGMASRSHTEAIALLACRMEEVERFDKMLNNSVDEKTGEKVNGYVYKTTNSYGDDILKEHPAVRLREKAARHVHSLLTEFGLTPAAAQKVGTPKKKEKKNEFEGF